MSFARHNIEKHRLIGLVRVNPILWDCRLPHYKRSDKRKAIKWNELGRAFGVSGERVQRTFTSLREIFRRELNHEKLLGSRFKSKWEYYDSMAFLKEVIRERKSRERVKSDCLPVVNNGGAGGGSIDEYQYFAPNDPNNPNNQQQQQQQTQSDLDYRQMDSLRQALSNPQQPQDQSKLLQQQKQQQQNEQEQKPQQQQQQQQQQQITHLQQNISTNILQTHLASQQQQNKLSQPDIISSIFSGSSSPSIYIKDEPDSQDEAISPSTTNNDKQGIGCSGINNSVVDGTAATVSIPPTQPSVSPIQPSVPPTTATEAVMESLTKPCATTSSKTIPTEASINCQQVSTTASVGNNNNYNQSNSDLNTNNNSKKSHYQTNNRSNHNFSKSTTIATKSYNIVDDIELLDGDCEDYDDLDDIDDDGDGEDDIDDIMGPTAAASVGIDVGVGTGITNRRFSAVTSATASSAATARRLRGRRHRASPREILYNKFGDFLAARLNTLHETTANDLMNRILLLIAEK